MPGVSVDILRSLASRLPASRQPTVITWKTATSNVEQPSYVSGHGLLCFDSKGQSEALLFDVYRLDLGLVHPVDCSYLVDDGSNIVPFFVAGWCLYDRSRLSTETCIVGVPAGYLRLRKQRPMAPHGARGPRRTWHLSISPLGTD